MAVSSRIPGYAGRHTHSKLFRPVTDKKEPPNDEWLFRLSSVRDPSAHDFRFLFLALRNQGSLSSPHLPTSIAFDVRVSEPTPAFKRLSFGVLAAHAIDAGHDR